MAELRVPPPPRRRRGRASDLRRRQLARHPSAAGQVLPDLGPRRGPSPGPGRGRRRGRGPRRPAGDLAVALLDQRRRHHGALRHPDRRLRPRPRGTRPHHPGDGSRSKTSSRPPPSTRSSPRCWPARPSQPLRHQDTKAYTKNDAFTSDGGHRIRNRRCSVFCAFGLGTRSPGVGLRRMPGLRIPERGLAFKRQHVLPIQYKEHRSNPGFASTFWSKILSCSKSKRWKPWPKFTPPSF